MGIHNPFHESRYPPFDRSILLSPEQRKSVHPVLLAIHFQKNPSCKKLGLSFDGKVPQFVVGGPTVLQVFWNEILQKNVLGSMGYFFGESVSQKPVGRLRFL